MVIARQLGNLELEPESYQVRVSGQPVALSSAEFKVLRLLAIEPLRVWSPEALVQEAGLVPDRSALATLIWRLRRKLEGSEPYTIATVRRRGYLLAAASTPRSDSDDDASAPHGGAYHGEG